MDAERSERITFPGADGAALAARLDLPRGRPRAYALFAHCFTCSKETLAASRVSRALAARGIAVLRFDFTGLGGSEGEFANTDFSSNVDDLVCAADYLRDGHEAPAILVGHSLGGAAVLAGAARVPEAAAVATIGAPSDPAHVARLFADRRSEIERTGEQEVEIAGRRFRIRKRFLDDIESQSLADRIAGLRRGLLVFHAPFDKVVGIDHAATIFEAAKHPKSFVSLDDADHLLTRRSDAEYVATVLAAWASRYVAEPSQPRLSDLPAQVVVGETGEGKFTQAMRVAGHRLRADEPASVGGDDTGPSPYDLLLASLGACTSMTLRMYADRKGLALDRVTVALDHEKIHAEDCADCETRKGKIDRIERRIHLEGDLDEDARERLLAIADKCPVHRTLESETRIETSLANPRS